MGSSGLEVVTKLIFFSIQKTFPCPIIYNTIIDRWTVSLSYYTGKSKKNEYGEKVRGLPFKLITYSKN